MFIVRNYHQSFSQMVYQCIPHHLCTKVPKCSTSLTFGITHFFLSLASIVITYCYHIAVLICISQMKNTGENLCICLATICISFLVKRLFVSFANFKIWFLIVIYLSLIFGYKTLLKIYNCKYFLPVYGLLFTVLRVGFDKWNPKLTSGIQFINLFVLQC